MATLTKKDLLEAILIPPYNREATKVTCYKGREHPMVMKTIYKKEILQEKY